MKKTSLLALFALLLAAVLFGCSAGPTEAQEVEDRMAAVLQQESGSFLYENATNIDGQADLQQAQCSFTCEDGRITYDEEQYLGEYGYTYRVKWQDGAYYESMAPQSAAGTEPAWTQRQGDLTQSPTLPLFYLTEDLSGYEFSLAEKVSEGGETVYRFERKMPPQADGRVYNQYTYTYRFGTDGAFLEKAVAFQYDYMGVSFSGATTLTAR